MDVTSITLDSWDLVIGAPVHDAAGTKLGTVRHADADAFVVGRGVLFGPDWELSLEEVDHYEDGGLILKHTAGELPP